MTSSEYDYRVKLKALSFILGVSMIFIGSAMFYVVIDKLNNAVDNNKSEFSIHYVKGEYYESLDCDFNEPDANYFVYCNWFNNNTQIRNAVEEVCVK